MILVLSGLCAGLGGAPQAHADLGEIERCDAIPSELVFAVEAGKTKGGAPVRVRQERYGTAWQILGANPEGVEQHGLAHVRNCSVRPSGRTTQRMRFDFRSEGYFAPDVVNHLAIGLQARSVGYREGLHSGQEGRQGRGLIIGTIREGWPKTRLCEGPFPLVQPETWGLAPGVTTLWGRGEGQQDYCGPTLKERTWYRFELSSAPGMLSYRVSDLQGKVLIERQLLDNHTPSAEREAIAGNSGYFLAVMCGDQDWTCRNTRPWRLVFRNFAVLWD